MLSSSDLAKGIRFVVERGRPAQVADQQFHRGPRPEAPDPGACGVPGV